MPWNSETRSDWPSVLRRPAKSCSAGVKAEKRKSGGGERNGQHERELVESLSVVDGRRRLPRGDRRSRAGRC